MTKDEIIEAGENKGFSIKGTDDENIVPDMVETNVVMLGMSYELWAMRILFN